MRTLLTSITTSPGGSSSKYSSKLEQLFVENSFEDRIYGGLYFEPYLAIVLSRLSYGEKYTNLWQHLELMDNPQECVEKIFKSPGYYCCINFKETLEAIFYSLPKVRQRGLLLREMTFLQGNSYIIVLAFPKNFPYAERINRRLAAFVESGIRDQWQMQGMAASESEPEPFLGGKTETESEEGGKELVGLKDLHILTLAFLVLYAASLLCFLLEVSLRGFGLLLLSH
jgi:hypothetical protein